MIGTRRMVSAAVMAFVLSGWCAVAPVAWAAVRPITHTIVRVTAARPIVVVRTSGVGLHLSTRSARRLVVQYRLPRYSRVTVLRRNGRWDVIVVLRKAHGPRTRLYVDVALPPSASVTASTRGGEISALGLYCRVSQASGGGPVTLRWAWPPQSVGVHTNGGPIVADGPWARVERLTSQGGPILVTGRPDYSTVVRVQSAGGPITSTFSALASEQVRSTVTARIHVAGRRGHGLLVMATGGGPATIYP